MSSASTARRLLLGVGLAMTIAGLSTSSAAAEFGPIGLISKSSKEQADKAEAPALSGDGRFVAFAAQIGGHDGVFRKDLQTGALALVAPFPNLESLALARPSISADGRYVAFTTKVALDPTNDVQAGSADVYVADTSATPPSYELATALDECDPADPAQAPCGLTYGGSEAGLGAVAAGRVALSADGRSVAFMTKAPSNLTGDPTKTEAPAGQVAVRRLATDQTVLITQKKGSTEPEPVPAGGAATASEGAAISGDGSTVAWVGRQLPRQVPMLGDEEAAVKAFEGPNPAAVEREYHEPLWRRVPSPLEEDPPTRRIVGGGDPLAPGCPPAGTLSEPACQGPFPNVAGEREFGEPLEINEGRGWGLSVPQLSADGNTVAVIGTPEEDPDLYVVDMAPGLSRRQAVRRLTRWVNLAPGRVPPEGLGLKFAEYNGALNSCAISPAGNRIAFATTRQVFPLNPPTLVTPRPGAIGVAELYQLDLTTDTIERVTPGVTSGVSLGGVTGATAPSYDDDGGRLAFASSAYNLVGGDTNEASDVFVVDSPPPAPVEETKISAHPAQITVRPLWRMTVTAVSQRDGSVRAVVGVPGTGSVRIKGRARLGKQLKLRVVASAHRVAVRAGVLWLTLRLPRKLIGLAHRTGGLDAELDVDFATTEGKPLHAAVDARFLAHKQKGKKR